MIKVKQHQSFLFKPITYNKMFSKRKIHFVLFLCWLAQIFIGTFLIGISTSLYSQTFQYCDDSQTFCSWTFILESDKDLNVYVVMDNFYQNNRMFLDSYSALQLQGNVGNNYHCQNYDTYQSIGVSQNAGGYRVNSNSSVFPCGEAMLNIFNDTTYLISSSGGSIQLDANDLTSQYSQIYKFKNLDNYQLKQWTDMQLFSFVNYFTIPYTSTKYNLVGKVSLLRDSYQLIVKNNFKTSNGTFSKKIIITQANALGIQDPLIGFYLFIMGIITLFFHLFMCCRGVKK